MALDFAQMMQMAGSMSPQHYTGTMPTSLAMAAANQAQDAAFRQADINSRNYAAELDLQKALAQITGGRDLARDQSGYSQELAKLNNSSELERLLASVSGQKDIAGMQTDASRYGAELGLQSQMAGVAGQRDVANIGAKSALEQAMLGSQTQLGLGNLNAQTQMGLGQLNANTALETTRLPLEAQSARFNAILPMLQGIAGQFGVTSSAPAAAPSTPSAPAMTPLPTQMPQATVQQAPYVPDARDAQIQELQNAYRQSEQQRNETMYAASAAAYPGASAMANRLNPTRNVALADAIRSGVYGPDALGGGGATGPVGSRTVGQTQMIGSVPVSDAVMSQYRNGGASATPQTFGMPGFDAMMASMGGAGGTGGASAGGGYSPSSYGSAVPSSYGSSPASSFASSMGAPSAADNYAQSGNPTPTWMNSVTPPATAPASASPATPAATPTTPAASAPAGGSMGTIPFSSNAPLISQQQQSQMLNNSLANNQRDAAGQMRQAQNTFGARGFAPTSPALRSFQNRVDFNRMNADTTARTQIPMQVSQANADYGLKTRASDIDAYRAKTGAISPLLSAFAGLV